MQQQIAQMMESLSDIRRNRTVMIGLLLIIAPVCNSLASIHDHSPQVRSYNTSTHIVDAHLSEPCHLLKAAPVTGAAFDSPRENPAPDVEIADFPSVPSLQSHTQAVSRTATNRNEQWCSDPSVHLMKCVFLN
jgi:hypothetical protein